MNKINKRVKSAIYVRHFESIFKCPTCGSSMKVSESKSLTCSRNHTFDFTKQGYLNLATNQMKTKYSRELFEARRKLMTEADFFDPLIQFISTVINEHSGNKKDEIAVLDTGCGEGSHLSTICDRLSSDFKKEVMGVGIDISKEGILTAAKNYSDKIWSVADLTNTPFQNGTFDVILNILSPSNYEEFNRLLNTNGLVVKVVPQSDYLKELREGLFDDPEKQRYTNAETVKRFNENFHFVDHSRLRYTVNLDNPFIQALVQMTPLSWAATNEQVNSFLEKDSAEITVDLDILIGKKT
ncbi:23S rRNA (guanine745-N1)-methyltransferase [Virgibacillus natechei]|uniref:23S rRNA (Guanine745-N1)-methyltransferase n=1 Tax=Virgibacillus natechei TaxID=1216297 RepID=A0ABS4IDQ1_9BACI|nr:methyltransferase domain-containing protein [Virgibacillus natechei]MBP1968466.1 23S rRNA (guanine745-N1)-methyltransferase [Virgibacillus natechei]